MNWKQLKQQIEAEREWWHVANRDAILKMAKEMFDFGVPSETVAHWVSEIIWAIADEYGD